jgi:hypothetical protein
VAAYWTALFFPHFHINEVPLAQLQACLRRSFQRWGLPRHIKADNGKPLGDPQKSSIPELSLWFIGLGISVVWNRLRTPKDNASVERMQRTTACWAEPQKCSTVEELQTRLRQAALLQTEKYELRRRAAKTRRQLYASLWNNKRTYKSSGFDIKRVYAYLQNLSFVRRVSKSGGFTFYAQCIYIGTQYQHQDLILKFNSRKVCWKVMAPGGAFIGCLPADNFSATAIKKLHVCRARNLKVVKLHGVNK